MAKGYMPNNKKKKHRTVECPYCLKVIDKSEYAVHAEEHERNSSENQLNSR